MSTERGIRRARHLHVTHRRWVILAALTYVLLTACDLGVSDTGPEIIDYCAETPAAARIETAAGCIARP